MDVSVVFVVTRKKASRVETLTGSLRDSDDQQWEALYLRNGELYLSQTCGTRALAEAHLASSAPRSKPSVGHGRPLRTRRRGGTRVGRVEVHCWRDGLRLAGPRYSRCHSRCRRPGALPR